MIASDNMNGAAIAHRRPGYILDLRNSKLLPLLARTLRHSQKNIVRAALDAGDELMLTFMIHPRVPLRAVLCSMLVIMLQAIYLPPAPAIGL